MKILKWTLLVIAVLFLVIQVVRPERTNPPVDRERTMQARLRMTPEVDAIFKRACMDCHSNETNWRWYTNVAPFSWLITEDVEHGRKHFNASDWASYDDSKAGKLLEEICEEVEDGKMPISNYVLIHPEAKLSAEDVRAICEWTKAQRAAPAQ